MVFKSLHNSPNYPSPPAKPSAPRPKHCTGCGKELAPDHEYCPKCGNKVLPLERDPYKTCTCGQLFGADDKFCASCGKQRSAAVAPAYAASIPKQPSLGRQRQRKKPTP